MVDMEDESEAWAICATIPGESEICHVTESDAHEYHNKEPDDEVLTVRKYELISPPGSATFELTDNFFFAETMDVRAVLSDRDFEPAKMATRASQRRVPGTDAKQRILRLIPIQE